MYGWSGFSLKRADYIPWGSCFGYFRDLEKWKYMKKNKSWRRMAGFVFLQLLCKIILSQGTCSALVCWGFF